ncbi:hypothetical protein B0H11DRAFT_1750466, partial [Mycena galericulata]
NFEIIIKEGNATGGFGKLKNNLRVGELLKDVKTRWSAIFWMINRLLKQHLVNILALSLAPRVTDITSGLLSKFLDDPKQDEFSWQGKLLILYMNVVYSLTDNDETISVRLHISRINGHFQPHRLISPFSENKFQWVARPNCLKVGVQFSKKGVLLPTSLFCDGSGP